jgi:hypothetical protein
MSASRGCHLWLLDGVAVCGVSVHEDVCNSKGACCLCCSIQQVYMRSALPATAGMEHAALRVNIAASHLSWASALYHPGHAALMSPQPETSHQRTFEPVCRADLLINPSADCRILYLALGAVLCSLHVCRAPLLSHTTLDPHQLLRNTRVPERGALAWMQPPPA